MFTFKKKFLKNLKYACSFWSVLLLVIGYQTSTHAAAWLQSAGDGFFFIQARPYISCNYWTTRGQIRKGACFNEFNLTPYLEYGIIPELTFIISPTFNTFNQSGNVSKFNAAYMMTAVRIQLWKKNWDALSFQLGYNQKFKSTTFGTASAPATPSDQVALAGIQSYLDIRLLYGIGGTMAPSGPETQQGIGTPGTTQPNTWYANFELAFQPVFTGGADIFQIDFMYGLKFFNQKLILELKELNTISLQNPRNPTDPNYNLFTAVGSAIYWFNQYFGIQAGIQQDFFGTNIGLGTSPFGSILIQF